MSMSACSTSKRKGVRGLRPNMVIGSEIEYWEHRKNLDVMFAALDPLPDPHDLKVFEQSLSRFAFANTSPEIEERLLEYVYNIIWQGPQNPAKSLARKIALNRLKKTYHLLHWGTKEYQEQRKREFTRYFDLIPLTMIWACLKELVHYSSCAEESGYVYYLEDWANIKRILLRVLEYEDTFALDQLKELHEKLSAVYKTKMQNITIEIPVVVCRSEDPLRHSEHLGALRETIKILEQIKKLKDSRGIPQTHEIVSKGMFDLLE